MIYDLAINNGDLDLVNTHARVLTGIRKLEQEIKHLILERRGNDRFHQLWGSLQSTKMGEDNTSEVVFFLRSSILVPT
ncbi:MAG: hypothetical protein FWE48_02595 [Coriobacteriia bacterium]|nr:hypothetical protein [Coriobacteriia bacterium]MCL2870782.1 hypothetical protein [Coriobacteriia bacterium]